MQEKKIERLELKNEEIRVSERNVCSFYTHQHGYYELLLYRPFEGCVTVNNESIIIDSLTAVLIIPGDLHKIEVKPNQNVRLIKIEINRSALVGQHEPQNSRVLQNLPVESVTVLAFSEALTADNDSAYLTLLIMLICNRLEALGSPIVSAKELPGFSVASQAAEFLGHNFSMPLSLTDVAARLNVSPQYLSFVFKKTVGVGFSVYLNRLRLRRAASLLQYTNNTITAVCYDCGYQNLSHFLRIFKKQYGMTPRQYRQMHASQD